MLARARSRSALAPWLGAAALLLACSEASEPGSRDVSAAAAKGPPAQVVLLPPTRGLWVLCEGSARPLEDPAEIEALIDHARQLGVSDLFVQVYRGGRAWFESARADAGPFAEIREATGLDPLAETIERAHAAGLRVHAWVNVLSLARNRDAPILEELGREAVHVDRRGRSLLDYPDLEVPSPERGFYRMGTRGLYLDPAAQGVREWLASTFAELAARYPQLDGVHLDYIRHPLVLPIAPGSRFGVGLDFGYGASSRARYQRETGEPDPFRDPDSPATSAIVRANEWDAWRRQQVTALVAEIRTSLDAVRPGVELSAAVIPYADRAYLSIAQDWRRWLEENLVNFVVPMLYTRDQRLFGYQADALGGGRSPERTWAGIGVWLFATEPEGAVAQVHAARGAGLPRDALFSYDALIEAPKLFEAVAATAVPAAR